MPVVLLEDSSGRQASIATGEASAVSGGVVEKRIAGLDAGVGFGLEDNGPVGQQARGAFALAFGHGK